jgi:hypothetical protein
MYTQESIEAQIIFVVSGLQGIHIDCVELPNQNVPKFVSTSVKHLIFYRRTRCRVTKL